MEVVFAMAFSNSRLDVYDVQRVNGFNHLSFLMDLDPCRKLHVPIQQRMVNSQKESYELRQYLHKKIDEMFDDAIMVADFSVQRKPWIVTCLKSTIFKGGVFGHRADEREANELVDMCKRHDPNSEWEVSYRNV